MKSPDPSWPGHVPLVRSWVLAKKAGKPIIWVEPVVDRDTTTVRYALREGGTPQVPSVDGGNGVCVATGAPIPGEYIKAEANAGRMGQSLMAIVADGRGKTYLPPDTSELPDVPSAPWGVSGLVPRHLTGGTCAVYGLDDWAKLFTPRQTLALTTFSDLLTEVRDAIEGDAVAAGLPADGMRLRDGGSGARARADAVVTYLAFVIDKCADYWSSICTWNAPNGQLRYTFSEEQIPMTWDFAEANPFSGAGGSWEKLLENEVKAIPTVGLSGVGYTAQRDARARIAEVGECVISTDPPYYDNISYADLSDYFYVWLRRNLSDVWPGRNGYAAHA